MSKKNDLVVTNNKIVFGQTVISTASYRDAQITTTISDLGGNQITQHGHCWSLNQNPTTSDAKSSQGTLNTATSFTTDLNNLNPGVTYYVRAYATNSQVTAYGNELSFTTEQTNIETGTMYDSRDGQTYNTVKIGEQWWMAENLNIGTRIDGVLDMENNLTIEKYCQDDDENNCDEYGGLYQWDELMTYKTQEAVQGICPEGWHIPTDNDWKILEGSIDSQYGVGNNEWDKDGWRGYDAGIRLKSTNQYPTSWISGNDNFGFSALPAGSRNNYGTKGLGNYTVWWTSTVDSYNNLPLNRELDHNTVGVYHDYFNSKQMGYSVRCIKD